MPFPVSPNEVATTVSEKLSATAQSAMGSLGSGLQAGTMAFGGSQVSSIYSALSSKASSLLNGTGFSAASLPGCAAQVTSALDQTSSFKGTQKEAESPTKSSTPPTPPKSKRAHYKFPHDLGKHFMQITFSTFNKNSPVGRDKFLDDVIISLPLSPNLAETYQANYKTENLGVLGTLAGGVVSRYLQQEGGTFDLSEKGGKKLGEFLNKELSAGDEKKGIAEGALRTQVKESAAALLAQAGQAALGPVASAISQNLGATLNPNLAAMFDNIGFRSHQFAFKLYPKSKEESREIKQIIQTIRSRMLPPTLGTMFLGYPDRAQINIYPTQPYPILDCVLESMQVNYAPNGPAFYGGELGYPVEVDLQLSFKEIQLFTRDMSLNEYYTGSVAPMNYNDEGM